MEKYGVNDLRRMFLEFFESKGHLKMKSFSLIPHNDNSLLLINSGMAPLKPYFTGAVIPPRRRVTTCQKCIRTGDIENVGKTSRHGTFFEMLGNFSFGDYFKREAIHWSWEFLTEVVGLSPDRLYPSVYLDDDEAFEIWNKEIGIDKERIFKFGKADNFWEHGAGPCGPCSEIYYDRGEKYGCHKEGCTVGCECDRYMEVWNNVFTQFDNDGNGNYTELEQKNIDTGMGLERLAVIVQDVDSIFDVDTIRAIRDYVCKLANCNYNEDHEKDVSIRLITDHIRSATFMISDGIMPTNEGRGYVLRRLIRRAARHGRILGMPETFLHELALVVIDQAKDGYPELEEKKDFIVKVLSQEEEKFNKTLDMGLSILNDMMDEVDDTILSGKDAFKLYDTYGFPLELTKEILEEKGIKLDEEGFRENMKKQREQARAARAVSNYMGADSTVYDELPVDITSKFIGYDNVSNESEIIGLTSDKEVLEEAIGDERFSVIVKETCFYPTMGGQNGDSGIIEGPNGVMEVEDTIKLAGDKIAHIGYLKEGYLKMGDTVKLMPDMAERADTCKNHSATHLLHRALREVLGNHVQQKGSLVTPDRLRFDFSHFSAMTPDEIRRVEEIVNREIQKDDIVDTQVKDIEEAKKDGAMALFGEKYSDKVRVVSMGDFSKELCGGTHVKHTGEIGQLKILSEAGIASGVRRIEAITGKAVFKYYAHLEETLDEIASMMKANKDNVVERVQTLKDDYKQLQSEVESLKQKEARANIGNISEKVKEIDGVKVLTLDCEEADMNSLRNLADELKQKLGNAVIVLAGHAGEKASIFATASDEAVKAGAHSGKLIKEIASLIGGGGGGKPESAQAGGKKIDAIKDALQRAEKVINDQITKKDGK